MAAVDYEAQIYVLRRPTRQQQQQVVYMSITLSKQTSTIVIEGGEGVWCGLSVKEEYSAAQPSCLYLGQLWRRGGKKFGRLVASSPGTQRACVRKEICICDSRE